MLQYKFVIESFNYCQATQLGALKSSLEHFNGHTNYIGPIQGWLLSAEVFGGTLGGA